MKPLRTLLVSAAALAVLGCADAVSPDAPAPTAAKAKADRLSAGSQTTACTAPSAIKLADWAPPLTTYDTTFVAVQGKPSTHAVYFQQASWMLAPVKFMELDIPARATFVDADGVPVPKGAAVPITVHADRGVISFQFGPRGSTFSVRTPAVLSVWWLFADFGSLSADGLKIWYQPGCDTSWEALATEVDFAGAYLKAPIYHFSNYAVAW